MKILASLLAASSLATFALASNDYVNSSTVTIASIYGSNLSTLATMNGNIFAAGYIKTSASDADLYVMARNQAGGPLWTKSIATNGIGLNQSVRLIAYGGDLFLAGTVYKSYNGFSRSTIYLARLNPTNGNVLWEQTVPFGIAKDLAVAGPPNDFRIMVVGQEYNSGDQNQKRYVALSASSDGTLIRSFRAATYDGSVGMATAGISNSFVVGVFGSSGSAVVKQLDLHGVEGWSKDITFGHTWMNLRLASCDPAQSSDHAVFGLAGRILATGVQATLLRFNASGDIVSNHGYTNIGGEGPVEPKAWKNGFLTVAGGTFNATQTSYLFQFGQGGTYESPLDQTEGDMQPNGMCLDQYGSFHIVETVSEPTGNPTVIRVSAGSYSSFGWEWNEQNATAYDILTNGNGNVYVAATKMSGFVEVGALLRLDPKGKANNDLLTLGKNQTLDLTSPGIFGNDIAAEGATATLPTMSHGILVPTGDGGLTYTPDAGYVGFDSAKYTLNAVGGTSQADLTFIVFPKILNLAFSDSAVVGGAGVTATITMSDPMPAWDVMAVSDNSSATDVPATTGVSPHLTTGTFAIATHPVGTNRSCVITVKYRGATYSKTLTVLAPAVKALAVSPSTVQGGNGFSGSVTLTGKAPQGGTVVALGHTGNEITLPASVVVPAGQSASPFSGMTSTVVASTLRSVSATANGVTKTVTLSITP